MWFTTANSLAPKKKPLKGENCEKLQISGTYLDKNAGYLNVRGLIQKTRGIEQRQMRKVQWKKSIATLPFVLALSIPRSPNRMNPGRVTKK